MVIVEIYGFANNKQKGRELFEKISSLRKDIIVSIVTTVSSEPYLKIFYNRCEVTSRNICSFFDGIFLEGIRIKAIFCPVPLIGPANSDLGPLNRDCWVFINGGSYFD